MLLIEVSDSSLRFDRRVKVPVYARNGIREVWVIDLLAEAIRNSVFSTAEQATYVGVIRPFSALAAAVQSGDR